MVSGPKFWRQTLSLAGLVLFAASTHAASPPPTVKVEKIPPRIERRTFDPKQPPADMPKLTPPEAAMCVYKFECDTRLGVVFPRLRLKTTSATVNLSQITARLSITIWTPENATPQIKAHEETHREICEVYYAAVDRFARPLASRYIGRKITVSGEDHDDAIDEVLRTLQSEMLAEFMENTAQRCLVAQQRFDAITKHGTNAVPNSEARDRALAEEEEARRPQ